MAFASPLIEKNRRFTHEQLTYRTVPLPIARKASRMNNLPIARCHCPLHASIYIYRFINIFIYIAPLVKSRSSGAVSLQWWSLDILCKKSKGSPYGEVSLQFSIWWSSLGSQLRRLGRSVESCSSLIESSDRWKAAEQFRDHEPYKPKTQNPKP